MSSPHPTVGDLEGRATHLAEVLTGLDAVVVAFSGGVDSSLLAHAAHRVFGRRAIAVTAVSPSLAATEREDCRRLASSWGMAHLEVDTAELDDPRYRANDGERCYWCKSALMDALGPLAAERDATVVLGVNLDDLDDHRPGQRAAAERGARFPLVDAGLDKAAVRAMARWEGLAVWDKPAAPCLASRLPYGTPVSVALLSEVERAERAVRDLGHRDVRVRHYGPRARVELPLGALADLGENDRTSVVDAVQAEGFADVELDPAGLRSGNLNDALAR